MDIDAIKNSLQQDFDWITTKRDEVRLQAHMAKAETRNELQRLEQAWQRAREQLRKVSEHKLSTVEQVGSEIGTLLGELKQGYERVRVELTTPSVPTAFAAAQTAAQSPFINAIDHLIQQVGGQAHAQAVYGSPVTHGAVTIVPVARVVGGLGVGQGPVDGPPGRSGIGGGAGFAAMPVGFIEIDANGARFHRLDSPAETWLGLAESALRLAQHGWSSWLGIRAARRSAGAR